MEKVKGKICNVNYKKIEQLNKRKTKIKNCIFSITTSAVMFFAGLGIGKASNSNYATIGDNQIMATISIDVSNGDTIYDIANKYYNENYENVFGSKSNYEKSIQLQNSLINSKIKIGDKLIIPVVIDKNNPYLQIIQTLNAKIAEIEQNNYWVEYTVRMGDTLSNLAALSSGSAGETIENVDKIARKNGLSPNNIYAGQKIYIINPGLGSLRIDLLETQNLLKESLINTTKIR